MTLTENRVLDDAAAEPPSSALRRTFGNRFYLAATISLFISGLGVSAAAPQIATFLVKELDASMATAGLYYLTSLTAPIGGYLIGSRSDRTGRRMGLFFLCSIIGSLGWAGVAFSTQLWMPFAITAVVLGFAGGAGSQLFAALHDDLTAHPAPNNDGVVAIVRMALTAGWVVGPVVGTMLASAAGLRTMMLVVALCWLVQVLPLIGCHPAPARLHTDESGAVHRPTLREMAPLLIFVLLYICVYAGEAVKYAYLPMRMQDQLGFSSGLSGAVIGIQPLIELILMPVAIIAARRWSMLPIMTLGAAFGVGANLFFALGDTAAGLFAGQILMGGVWGVFAALGIIMAQRLLPSAVATASAIFLSSGSISQALGGLTGGLGIAAWGLPHVFFIPAGFAVIATIGLATMATRERRSQPAG